MLYTKFEGHRPLDYEEQDFNYVLIIYGRGGDPCHIKMTIRANFRFVKAWRLLMKIGFNRPSGFRQDV